MSRTLLLATATGLVMALLAVSCSSDDTTAPNTTVEQTDTGGGRGADDGRSTVGSEPVTLARYADHTSQVYEDPAAWLCRPDADDICSTNQDTTVIEAGGTTYVEPWAADPDAPIDCFYVYPTISRDQSYYSDMDASDDEEGAAALNQVARLGSRCRVFAPIYRQRTLAGLAGTVQPDDGPTGEDGFGGPFDDVLDAWSTYMAHDNQGRGVVLIGHSQGAGLLKRLLQSEFDPDDHEDVRGILVAAYLAGGSVMVADGSSGTGGPDAKPDPTQPAVTEPDPTQPDLVNIPLCAKASDIGCVITWSTYRDRIPPPDDALFGRPGPEGSGLVSACVSPVHVSATHGGPPVPSDDQWIDATGYFPGTFDATMLVGASGSAPANRSLDQWIDTTGLPSVEGSSTAGPLTTPFVTVPGLVKVRCAEHDGYHYLEMTTVSVPGLKIDDIGGDLTPQWGMHLQDVNIVMGDIGALVENQTEAYIHG